MQHLTSGAQLQNGKYLIDRVLGQGGFGITYLAEHTLLQRKVAIKEFFMKEHCNRDEGTSMVSVGSTGSVDLVERFKTKFLKEARLIACMDNQHIVRVFDAFEENGTAYYVMEHLDNGNLNDLLAHIAFSEETALKFARQIADALDYIHAQNVLHLDVKPANVLLRKNGDAVLIDFGISKRYDQEGGQTSTTPTGISKGYAPLEQYNQGMQTFSPCTDVYSLGATVYKMITGNTPPEASAVNEDGMPAKPHGITDTTWNAIVKAMCPRRKDRPQSVAEFLQMLGTPVVAHVENVEVRSEATVARNGAEVSGQMVDDDSADVEFDVEGIKFKMIKVDGGTFDMKETVSSGFLGMSSKDIVQHTTLSTYYIAETQVTQALWKAVMGKNPSHFKGDNLPVEQVSWNDCQEFITKLTAKTGRTFRLPTEAEWEFAARGGKKSKGYKYSGSDDLDDVAWYGYNSNNKTHPVKIKQANELGIYDMSGNVWEWCSDWYDSYSSGTVTNPTGSTSGSYRVRRGGSWGINDTDCSSTYRSGNLPSYRFEYLGFRLALSPSR